MKRLAFLTVISLMVLNQGSCQSDKVDPWADLKRIESAIKPPIFPANDFLITAFGAKGDGTSDCTQAFAKAIEACRIAGGGHVVVPEGKYLSGAIHLKSNIDLHLNKGAEILFSQDTKSYLPLVLTRFEGIELMNYSPLIYAFEQENVAVTGEGTLNGQADKSHWWWWKGRWEGGGDSWKAGMPSQKEANVRLKVMAKDNIPVDKRIFGEGSYLRSSFIQPYKCKNVLIEGITIRNSPMWEIHPVLCTNVVVRNVKIDTHGPNNDGCDPESSSNVLIEGCYFDTGDDCIAIKSGRDHDGRRVNVPSENIIVRNCTMKDGHGGVVIGSEISGNVRNVYAENCDMNSPNLERALRIKSNSYRGGIVENIFMRNIKVGEVSDAIVLVEMDYAGEKGEHHPVVRNVQVKNVTSKKSKYGLRIFGEEAYPVTNFQIEECVFDNVEKGNLIKGANNINLTKVKINGKDQ